MLKCIHQDCFLDPERREMYMYGRIQLRTELVPTELKPGTIVEVITQDQVYYTIIVVSEFVLNNDSRPCIEKLMITVDGVMVGYGPLAKHVGKGMLRNSTEYMSSFCHIDLIKVGERFAYQPHIDSTHITVVVSDSPVRYIRVMNG